MWWFPLYHHFIVLSSLYDRGFSQSSFFIVLLIDPFPKSLFDCYTCRGFPNIILFMVVLAEDCLGLFIHHFSWRGFLQSCALLVPLICWPLNFLSFLCSASGICTCIGKPSWKRKPCIISEGFTTTTPPPNLLETIPKALAPLRKQNQIVPNFKFQGLKQC